MAVSEAQKEAKRRWRAKNREKERYYSRKATAKTFIREMANAEDLQELQEEISRMKSLQFAPMSDIISFARAKHSVPHARGG